MNNNTEQFHPARLTLTQQNFLNLLKTYVPLKKHGGIYSGYCPFCNNKKESYFSVYVHTKKWQCYACRRSGNIYDFIEQIEHLSPDSAIKFIKLFINHPDAENIPAEIRKKFMPDIALDQEKINNSELIIEPEAPIIAEPEAQEIKSEIKVEVIPDKINIYNSELIKDLLSSFPEHKEIAIIDSANSEIISSSINQLPSKDIQMLISFINILCKQCKKIVGDYKNNHPEISFQMNFTLDGNEKKLIWLPALCNNKYNALLVTDKNTLEKVFLMRLRSFFKKLEDSY